MKGIDILCASQAATSICISMEELAPSSSFSSVIQLGGNNISCSRLIDRYNPIIGDFRRIGGSGRTIEPLPPHSSGSRRIDDNGHNEPLPPPSSSNTRRSTCGRGRTEPLPPHSSKPPISLKSKNNNNKISATSKPSKETKKKRITTSWSCTKPSEFITPPSSTRYLLNEKELLDVLSHDYNDPILKLVPSSSSSSLVNSKSCKDVKVAADEYLNPPKPPSSTSHGDQVVVLRVSLHCRGCEKKMRKHLSRMEGVTSFNIDFAAKKVTVIGDVTPLGVLASISKVKNAQLWPPTLASDGKLQNISN